MGMSASQARYLNLMGRQNDLEFQGQQINQSRTTLSDQTNNLYSQLQNLDVPTPPVTQDFTKIVYNTSDGAVNYTLGLVRPSSKQEGAYNVDLNFTTVGDSLQSSNTESSISYSDATLNVSKVEPDYTTQPTGNFNTVTQGEAPEFYYNETAMAGSEIPQGADLSKYLLMEEDGNLVQATAPIDPNGTYYPTITVAEYEALDDTNKAGYAGAVAETETVENDIILQESDFSNYYVKLAGGSVQQLSSDSDFVEETDSGFKINLPAGAQLFELGGSEEISNPSPNSLLIGGNNALSYSEAYSKYSDGISWNSYEAAIKNSFGKDAKLDDFYFVITTNKAGAKDVKLYKKEDIPANQNSQGLTAKGFTYETGTYTDTVNMDYVDVQFDSSGRISKITIPTEFNPNTGEPTSWKELPVSSKTETDNEAYDAAMTKYEYKKYKYDQEQTEINAQMSIIQAQDKKLELKLQRLDNERTQITTEMEALDKVINDDIEASYKTFSG